MLTSPANYPHFELYVRELDRSILYALEHLGCAFLTLKDEQTACVKAIYEGKDVFLWLPTGFGKSMCYEVLPFIFDDKLGRRDRSTSY